MGIREIYKMLISECEDMGHVDRVARIAVMLGRELMLADEELLVLAEIGKIHDIGKIKISKHILNKPGKLNDNEYAEIQNHCRYGYEIYLACCEKDDEIAKSILEHHERVDGKGYPDGKLGHEIRFKSKIIAVADVLDALIAERVYKKGWSVDDACDYILSMSGKMFDEEVVCALMNICKCIEEIYNGNS